MSSREQLWTFVIGLEGENKHRSSIEHDLVACAKRLFVARNLELVEELCVELGYVDAADKDKLLLYPDQVSKDPLELCRVPKDDDKTRFEALFAHDVRFMRLFFSNSIYNAGLGGPDVSKPSSKMLEALKSIASTCGDVANAELLCHLRLVVGKLYEIHTPRGYPEHLSMSDAWLALRHAWGTPSYYFSIQELQFLMAISGTCVEIYTFSNGSFQKVDSLSLPPTTPDRPIRVVYDGSINTGRGHFSRLLCAAEWDDHDRTEAERLAEVREAERRACDIDVDIDRIEHLRRGAA